MVRCSKGFAGTSVGFLEYSGDIWTKSDITSNFSRAPEYFCHKMLSPDAGSRCGALAGFFSKSSRNNIRNDERKSLLDSDSHKLQRFVNRLLNVRDQKRVIFSAAWHDVFI